MNEYDGICIGAGAAGGYYLLGALDFFYSENHDKIKNVKVYAGTSIGGIIATLLSIGYTPYEILMYSCTFDIANMLVPSLDLKQIFSESWGFISTDELKVYLGKMILAKMDKIPTFKQLYDKNGNTLVFPTYQIHPTPQIMYMDKDTTPDLNVLEGLMRTINIPLIFDKCEQDEAIYVDGAIVDSCPSKYVLANYKCKKILSVRLGNSKINKMKTILDYIKRIISIFEFLQDHNSDDRVDDVVLTTELEKFTLNIDVKKRHQYYKTGRNQTYTHFFGKAKAD